MDRPVLNFAMKNNQRSYFQRIQSWHVTICYVTVYSRLPRYLLRQEILFNDIRQGAESMNCRTEQTKGLDLFWRRDIDEVACWFKFVGYSYSCDSLELVFDLDIWF